LLSYIYIYILPSFIIWFGYLVKDSEDDTGP